MSQPLGIGMRLAEKEADERITEKAWQLYLTILPHQDPKKRVSFEEILERMSPRKKGRTKEKEITKEMLDHYNDVADLVSKR